MPTNVDLFWNGPRTNATRSFESSIPAMPPENLLLPHLIYDAHYYRKRVAAGGMKSPQAAAGMVVGLAPAPLNLAPGDYLVIGCPHRSLPDFHAQRKT